MTDHRGRAGDESLSTQRFCNNEEFFIVESMKDYYGGGVKVGSIGKDGFMQRNGCLLILSDQ